MISPRNACCQAEGDHCYAECRSAGNARVCREIRQALKLSERLLRITILAALNQPFGEWGKIFPDPAMTLAAVDRLVHNLCDFLSCQHTVPGDYFGICDWIRTFA